MKRTAIIPFIILSVTNFSFTQKKEAPTENIKFGKIEGVKKHQTTYPYSPEELDEFTKLCQTVLGDFDKGEFDKVELKIEKIEMMMPQFEKSFMHSNAIHKLNIAKGRMALKEGDVQLAKIFLFKSAKIKGSPQLSSFGPNMSLVKDLAEVKEFESAIEYLKLCKNFWQTDFGKLDYWISKLKENEVPHFGANLLY